MKARNCSIPFEMKFLFIILNRIIVTLFQPIYVNVLSCKLLSLCQQSHLVSMEMQFFLFIYFSIFPVVSLLQNLILSRLLNM